MTGIAQLPWPGSEMFTSVVAVLMVLLGAAVWVKKLLERPSRGVGKSAESVRNMSLDAYKNEVENQMEELKTEIRNLEEKMWRNVQNRRTEIDRRLEKHETIMMTHSEQIGELRGERKRSQR